MNDKVNNAEYKLDSLKWAVVALLVGAGVYGNSYFAAESMLYRVIGLLVLAGVAGWIATQTSKGSALVTLCMEARTEIRKVVWPTRAETTQTTMIVVVVVIIVAIILWGLDTLLSWLISLVIG
ncbi:MAG: preprotein translocase subunit SecE [Gammaproteobacteria bacterium]|nr:preprotein translocase subunit SecE [Gammaproteobacteria bacterium]